MFLGIAASSSVSSNHVVLHVIKSPTRSNRTKNRISAHLGWSSLFRNGRQTARFRISIKDNKTSVSTKVELIESRGVFGEQRFLLRVNGRQPVTLRRQH